MYVYLLLIEESTLFMENICCVSMIREPGVRVGWSNIAAWDFPRLCEDESAGNAGGEAFRFVASLRTESLWPRLSC